MIYQMLVLILAIGAIAFTSVLLFAFKSRNGPSVLYKKESPYNRIMVFEDNFIRTLRFGDRANSGKQSRIDIRDPDILMLEYTRLVFAGVLINGNPEKMLIIGMGGGVIPRAVRKYFPDMEIDVVEIDLKVVNVAKKYFFFKPDDKLRVHISDGRSYVQELIKTNQEKKYDLIVLDAYNSKFIPFHMITKEFLGEVLSILTPGGVVVANVLTDHRLFRSELKTFQAVFNRCYVFMGKRVNNAALVSTGPNVQVPDYRKNF